LPQHCSSPSPRETASRGFLSAPRLATGSQSAAMGETLMQHLARRDRWAPGREARDVDLVQETRGAESPLPRRRRHRGVALPVFSLVLFTGLLYAAWELISLVHVVPDFILPTPLQVAQDFGLEFSRGGLLANAGVTLQEALGGFALAAVVAGVLGYAIAHLRPLEVLVAPFIAASQAIPVVAVAPIIILLLGAGLLPKVLIGAVVVVFPLLITVVTGLRGV